VELTYPVQDIKAITNTIGAGDKKKKKANKKELNELLGNINSSIKRNMGVPEASPTSHAGPSEEKGKDKKDKKPNGDDTKKQGDKKGGKEEKQGKGKEEKENEKGKASKKEGSRRAKKLAKADSITIEINDEVKDKNEKKDKKAKKTKKDEKGGKGKHRAENGSKAEKKKAKGGDEESSKSNEEDSSSNNSLSSDKLQDDPGSARFLKGSPTEGEGEGKPQPTEYRPFPKLRKDSNEPKND